MEIKADIQAMDIMQTDANYIAGTYARFPLHIAKGKGATAYDEQGKAYIDFGSGIAVNTFGYSDRSWVDAVVEQLNTLQHCSNLYYTSPGAKLAQILCERTGMKKVFFGNSGAEANECAIKVARKWAFDKYGDESHSTIITLKNSFHGRTMATLTATGQDSFHSKFGPFLPGFVYADPNNADELEKLAAGGECCAIMMELIQGESGVNVLCREYVNAAVQIAKKNDMLIIIDEVQTGNGRTGELYSFMHYGINPDIVSTAKGLAGGLPIGACMLGEKVQNVLDAGSHGSTFGANPICCAGAINVLSRLTDGLLNEVKQKSQYIFDELQSAAGVVSCSGIGLMIGIKTQKQAAQVIKDCRDKGLLVLSAKDKVRLLPPLNISWEELRSGMNILKEVLA